MIFRAPDTIEKEEFPIQKGANWYLKLTATPNRIFGENVLVVAQMSDQWPVESNEVPVLKFEDRVALNCLVSLQRLIFTKLFFPTFEGSIGVCPLESGEQYWYARIKGHFLYPLAGAFANPLTATEGSSNGELSSWSNIFAGVLRDLGIDPEEKKKKPNKKKKKVITIDVEVTSKKGGSSRATAGASKKGEKKTCAAGSKSSGSAGSRNPDAGATPSSIALDEEEEKEEQEEEPALKLVSWKRSREETAAGVKAAQKAEGVPVIGKQSRLRTLYKFSPEAQKKTLEKTKDIELKDPKEPAVKKTKFTIKHPR
ncbi:hypothetical protein Hanom_Chr12g01167751 [Helianthus anomalus]